MPLCPACKHDALATSRSLLEPRWSRWLRRLLPGGAASSSPSAPRRCDECGGDYYELIDLTGEAHLSEEERDALEQIAAENDRVLVEHLADKLEARGETYAAYYLRHVATVEIPESDAKLRDLR